jgi:SAM-dependent methyltransferase
MDIEPGNVDVCRKRFADRLNATAMVCNGFDLQPIPGSSITLVYCFDAMVHFNPDVVKSYLYDTYRVLKPGGRGFFHHSNYTGGPDWKLNPASRTYMSAAIFAGYAKEAGLSIIRQHVINGDRHADLDCLLSQ